MTPRPPGHGAAVVTAAFVTFLWSTSWVLIKVGLAADLPPLPFAGLRYAFAALCLLALAAALLSALACLGLPGGRAAAWGAGPLP